MRNFKKITVSLFLLGNTAMAAPLGNTLYNILPSVTNLTVSSQGSGSVLYTVINNATASATPSITPGYQSSGNNLTIGSNTCNQSLPPGASCTFRVLFSGSNQPNNFTITPRVCGFNRFICSIPSSDVTVSVISPAAGVVPRAYEEVTGGSTTNLFGINIYDTSDIISSLLEDSQGINSVAISPDGSKVYATQFNNGASVVFFDVVDNALIRNRIVSLPSIGFSLHMSPPVDLQMVISPDGSTLFVTYSSGVSLGIKKPGVPVGGTLFRIDTAADAGTVTTIADPDNILNNPRGLAVSPDGKTLYVGTDADYIVALQTNADSVHSNNKIADGQIPVDDHLGLAIDPAGNKLYVGNFTAGSVNILGVNGTQGHLEEIILSSGYEGACGLAVSPDGTTLYVAEIYDNKVLAVPLNNPSEPLVQEGITSAFGLGLSLNGSTLYITQSEDSIGSTTVINTADFLATPTIVSLESNGSSSTIGQFIGP